MIDPFPPPRAASVAGICHDDVTRLSRALSGVGYPVAKWQLIDHAQRDPAGLGRDDRQYAIDVLWALPRGRYTDLPHVLAAAARTTRGHPRHGTPTG